jgi:hypothetical protein
MAVREITVACCAAGLAVLSGCSLPRGVTGTSDGGVSPPIDTGNGTIDVGPSPHDAGIDAFAPGVDAFVPPDDAWTMPGTDAWTAPNDAWTPPPVDAWTPPPDDAWTPPPGDAWVPPNDAWTPPPVDAAMPRTCAQIYDDGSNNYHECATSSTSCTFYASLGGDDCDAMCGAHGGTCISAADNWIATYCSNSGLAGNQCNDGRSGGICNCTRPF